MMKRVLALVAPVLMLGACATSKPVSRPMDLPFTRVYRGTFDSVWNATVNVLDIYSIAVANRESGLLRTEWAEARFNSDLYEFPDRDERLEEVRYRLKIKLSKGVVAQDGGQAVRVQVTKELAQYKNFFSDWERQPTDQIEENVILYRVSQRLKIAEALKRKSVGSKEATSKN